MVRRKPTLLVLGLLGKKNDEGLVGKGKKRLRCIILEFADQEKSLCHNRSTIFKQNVLEKEMEPHLIRDLLNRFSKKSIKDIVMQGDSLSFVVVNMINVKLIKGENDNIGLRTKKTPYFLGKLSGRCDLKSGNVIEQSHGWSIWICLMWGTHHKTPPWQTWGFEGQKPALPWHQSWQMFWVFFGGGK